MRRSLLVSLMSLGLMGLAAAPAAAEPLRIATGADSGVDGYLDVAPDEYGSWAVPFTGGEGPNDDHFNPAGDAGLLQSAFTSGFFLFVPVGSRKELLSDNADWQAVFAADASLSREVLSANVASDTNADGVDDMLTSSFRAFRATTVILEFDLVQQVSSAGAGVAVIRQDYTITNTAATAVTFSLVRAFDGDILWDADFGSDEVGTTMHSMDVGPFVFEKDPGDETTAITLSSTSATAYYGGKFGVEPEGGPPAYGFGTDVQIWDELGIPDSWINHIAGVGYDTDGNSGSQPPGSGDPWDGFVGLGFDFTLDPGASTTLTVFHTYGQATPAGEEPPTECEGDANGDNVVDPLDSGYVLSRFGCSVGTGDPDCDAADVNGDNVVDPLDAGFVLSRFGECP